MKKQGRSSETGATRGLMLQYFTTGMEADVSSLRKMGCIGWVSDGETVDRYDYISFAVCRTFVASFAQTFLGLNQRVIEGPFRFLSISQKNEKSKASNS